MKMSTKAKKSLEKVQEMFKEGDFPERIAKTYITGEGRPSDNWSLCNRVVMIANRTGDARGYKQWQKVGRQVSKGSRAFHILGPSIIKKEETNEDGETETESVLVGFHAIPVFRYEDTEGDPLPEPEPEELPPLTEILEKLGYELTYEPHAGGTAPTGGTDIGNKKIRLMSEDKRVFFHELAHAIHNEIEALKGGQWSGQEVIAETVAAVLCHMYGYEGYIQHSEEYINSYSGGHALAALAKHIRKIEKILNYIFKDKEEKDTCRVINVP